MSATIRIKRTTTSNRPSSLANAELAFIEGSNILVYGTGSGGAGGSATSIIDIGGSGAFLGLSNSLTQTAAGTYTFSGAVTFSGTTALGAATATTASTNDNSTRVATTEWVKNQGYGTSSGTVTSVALSLPSIFSVSGSPVTSSGTLTGSLATQNANIVFAGPTTGSAAAPTFRSLVSGDIPDLSATYATLAGGSAQTISRDTTLSGTVNVSGTLQIGGTSVTSSAAELNLVDGSVANTVVNSKAVIYGSAGEIAASSISTTGNGTIGGNLTVTGDLLVSGDTVTVNVGTVEVEDKNIVLGKVGSPSDSTADGGGITLKGSTDHTFNWVDATDAWTSSEHLNLLTGKAYYINGASVLSSNTLGSGVTASSLTSVGTLTSGALGTGFTAVGVAQGGTGLTSAVSGLLKGAAGSYSAATAGTDYLAPDSTIDGGTYS